MPAPRTLHRAILLVVTALAVIVGSLSPVAAATPAPAALPAAEAVEPPAPTATITGLVNGPNGELLDNITVEALDPVNPDAEPIASDLTYEGAGSAHGAFTLHVPAGTYKVRYSSPDWASTVYETLYYGGGSGTDVTVADGGNASLEAVTLTRDTGVPVSGQVLDQAGQPIANAEVTLFRVSADNELYDVAWTATRADGSYTFARVNRNRRYTVRADGRWADSGQYPALYLGNKVAPSDAERFTLPTDSAGTTLNPITLPATASATGTAIDESGSPVRYVDVALLAANATTGAYEYVSGWASTDRTGRFEITGLVPGQLYTVELSAYWQDYDPAYLGGGTDLATAEGFTPTVAGGTQDLGAITMVKRPVVVTGDVSDLNDVPAEGVDVTLYELTSADGWQDWDAVENTTTDATGVYQLDRAVPGGTYTVQVDGWSAGLGIQYLGGVDLRADATTFSLPEDGSQLTLDRIRLDREATTVRGPVQLSDGAVIDGSVDAELYRWDEASTSWMPVDYSWSDTGRFRFRDVSSGTYTVRADYQPDYGHDPYGEGWLGGMGMPASPTADGAFEVTDTLADVTPGPITLTRGRILSGAITAADGALLSGDAQVDLYRWDAGTGRFVWQDRTYPWGGEGYHFIDVPAGTYAVMAEYEPWAQNRRYLPTWRGGAEPTDPTSPGVFEVPATGDVPNIDVALQPGTLVTGTATTPSGSPLESVWVSVERWVQDDTGAWTTERAGEDWTDSDGHYQVPVAAGSEVWVHAHRARLEPYYLGGSSWPTTKDETNTLSVGTTDVNHDIEVAVAWGSLGSGAVQRLDHCVQQPAWRRDWIDFGPEGGLYLRGTGVLSDQVIGNYWPELLEPAGRASVLAPFLDRRGNRNRGETSWGVSPDGNSLCVLWNGVRFTPGTDTNTYQALVTKDPAGGYTVTYNYDEISWSRDALVGYNAGTGAPGSQQVFPGSEADGYQDTATTGLVHGSLGSTQPGRYQFHFDGFSGNPASRPVNFRRPIVQGEMIVGRPLTATAGRWFVDGAEATDLDVVYTWIRSGVGPDRVIGHGPTYVVAPEDEGAQIWARVQASQGTAQPGFASTRRAMRLQATVAPTLSGNPAVGETLTVDPGVWNMGEPTFTYEWVVGSNIVEPDADSGGTRYTLTESDAGRHVTVEVTAHMPGFRDGYAVVSSPIVASAGTEFGTLTGAVRTAGTGSPVAEAWWQACERGTHRCMWGETASDGTFVANGARATAEGVVYDITVFAPWGSDLRDASTEATVRVGEPATVTVTLEAPTPPPANVSVPTSQGTYQGSPLVFWTDPQEIEVEGCVVDEPRYTVTFTDGTPSRGGTLTKVGDLPDGRAAYEATIPPFYPAHDLTTISTNIPADCAPGSEPTSFTVYIDPSGVVTDQYGRTIDQATVTLLRSDSPGGQFTIVPQGSTIMSEQNRTNPVVTDSTGYFRWDVTEGFYKVQVDAAGCARHTTEALPVPPPAIDLLLKLECTASQPEPTVPASITGVAKPGSTLTAATATWGGSIAPTGLQWFRDGQPIAGATASTYDVTSADVGTRLTVQSSGRRPQYVQEEGTGAPVDFSPVSATSAGVTVTPGDAANATAAPAISGTAKVGSTLTASTGTWNAPGLTFGYQWLRNGTPITGATGSTYTLAPADAGGNVTVRVTASRAGYADGNATSAAVTVAPGDAANATAAPAITGTAKVGSTLTASTGTWNASGLTFGYQWLRNGTPIPGATASTYKLVPADVVKTITVRVSAGKAGYTSGVAASSGVQVAKLDSSIRLVLAKAKIPTGTAAKVVAVVKVPGLAAPTGKVSILAGKKVIETVTLATRAKGKVTIALGKLRAGKYALTAKYSGTGEVDNATSGKATLTVVKR